MPEQRREELSTQDEVRLVLQGLRSQTGIDPERVGPVLDLAAVGLVNGAWRNSVLEDWHACGGGLDDGAMMRLNAHATWKVRGIIRRWRAEVGLQADSLAVALDEVDSDLVDQLAFRIFRWLTNPARRLPTGPTLVELAGEDLREFTDHVEEFLGGIAASAVNRGARLALSRAAIHGGLACPHWWGTRTWPEIVTAFVAALGDPDHDHWQRFSTGHARWASQPVSLSDRRRLRRLLLSQPWELTSDEAAWITGEGMIGFLRPPLPARPPGEDAC